MKYILLIILIFSWSICFWFEKCEYPAIYDANNCIPAIDGDWYAQWTDGNCTMPANYRVNGNIYLQGQTINLISAFYIWNNTAINVWWWRFYTTLNWRFQVWNWDKKGYCIDYSYWRWWITSCPEWTNVIHTCQPTRMVNNLERVNVTQSWKMHCARISSIWQWWSENRCWTSPSNPIAENWQCWSDNWQYLYSTPVNLCVKWTPTSISWSWPWYWSCLWIDWWIWVSCSSIWTTTNYCTLDSTLDCILE